MKTLATLGEPFLKRHAWLLDLARSCEVAICGGCAAAISKGREDYVPADLDLVATKGAALRFVDNVNHFLLGKSVHFRVYANSKNDFVPEPALAHFRIQCPFWEPVCLFVLPDDAFRFYRIEGGHLLQLPQDVKQAADALTSKDAKPRLANEPGPIENPDDWSWLDDTPDEPRERLTVKSHLHDAEAIIQNGFDKFFPNNPVNPGYGQPS